MRRYRKGQTFRPPTAAESAAQSDTIEGFRRRPSQPPGRQGPRVHLGKLNANLLYSDTTTGVTVSIWRGTPLADSGEDIPGVLPPPYMTSGQLDLGDWIKIEFINGRWYAMGAACE